MTEKIEPSGRMFRHARFPVEKERSLIENFACEKTGEETAQSAGLDKKTVDKYFLNIRSRISRGVLKQNKEKLDHLDFDQRHLLSRIIKGKENLRDFKIDPGFPILYVSLPDQTSIAEVICSALPQEHQRIESELFDLSKKTKIAYGITDWHFQRKSSRLIQGSFFFPETTTNEKCVRGDFYDFVNFLLNRRRRLYGAAPDNRYAVMRLHEDQWRFNNLASFEELLYTCADYRSYRKARKKIPFKRPSSIWRNLPEKLSEILKGFPG